MEAVSESEWQEMKGIAILAQQSGFPRIQADPQHVIDLIDQRSALLEALKLCEGNISSLLASNHPKVFGCWLHVVRAAIKSATGQ